MIYPLFSLNSSSVLIHEEQQKLKVNRPSISSATSIQAISFYQQKTVFRKRFGQWFSIEQIHGEKQSGILRNKVGRGLTRRRHEEGSASIRLEMKDLDNWDVCNMAGRFSLSLAIIKMNRSTSLIALIAIIATLLATGQASFDCSSVTAAQCGVGLCINHKMVSGVCSAFTSSYCPEGSGWSNSSSNNCVGCSTLNMSSCTSTCSSYYFVQVVGNATGASSCSSCKIAYGQGCASCDNMHCLSCETNMGGLVLSSDSSSCVHSLCSLSRCLQCSNSTNCVLCSTGFVVSGGSCIPATCSKPYCTTCNGNICLNCAQNYALTNGSCISICTDTNCLQCSSSSICIKCASGYVVNPNNGLCVLDCTGNTILNCYQCSSNSVCLQCISGFQLSSGGSECTTNCIIASCDVCTVNATVCDRCYMGFKVVDGKCLDDICSIYNCKSCATTTTCQTCYVGFAPTPTATACEPICRSVEPNCELCSSNSACKKCYAGFQVTAKSLCQPICNINLCAICLTASKCQTCTNGYRLSPDSTSCIMDCGIAECATCSNSTVCSSCNAGFVLTNNSCTLGCRKGFVNTGSDSNVVCQSCPAVLPYCDSCSYSNGVYTCNDCPVAFYRADNKCIRCLDTIPRCLFCSSATACTTCLFPDIVTADGSCAAVPCTVDNCQRCSKSSSITCQICAPGFISKDNSCLPPTCSKGASLINGVCACGEGLYLSGGTCVRCADSKCTACLSASACTACSKGYFPSGSKCQSCSSNCDVCSSATVCTQCTSSFTLDEGKCTSLGEGVSAAKKGGKFVPCEPGCAACTSAVTGVVCTVLKSGYTTLGGVITRCNQKCATCASGSPDICTSCYKSNVLIGGDCVTCVDPLALACLDANRAYSVICINGYTAAASLTLSGGTCRPCALNCTYCDESGPNNCDAGHCQQGFVILSGTTNCTACFDSCSVCNPDDLNECLSCGVRRYLNSNEKKCYLCPTGCKTCQSATNCTGCSSGYSLKNNLCRANPKYPCTTLDDNNQCSDCFSGYQLNSATKVCQNSIACNSDASCQACPYGYYLNPTTKMCLECSLSANCVTCNATAPAECAICSRGYYLAAAGTCSSCSSNCLDCSSSSFCNEAADGYYVALNFDGTSSGRSVACSSPCKTCSNNPDFCLSCVTGYSISGSICQSDSVADVEIVVGAGSGSNKIFQDSDSSDLQVKKALRSTNRLSQSLCKSLPAFYRQLFPDCRGRLRFRSIKWGSIIFDVQVNTDGAGDALTVSNAIQKSIVDKGIDGLQIQRVSVIATGTTQTTSVNIGLILGVAIPATLLVTIIVVLIVKSNKIDEETAQSGSQKDAQGDSQKDIHLVSIDGQSEDI